MLRRGNGSGNRQNAADVADAAPRLLDRRTGCADGQHCPIRGQARSPAIAQLSQLEENRLRVGLLADLGKPSA